MLKRHKKFFLTILFFVIGIVILISLLKYTNINPDNIIHAVKNTGYRYLIGVILVHQIVLYVFAKKWHYILIALGYDLKYKSGFLCFLTSLSMLTNIFAPLVGSFITRVIPLKKTYNIPIKVSLAVLAVDQLYQLIIFLISLVPSILFITNAISINQAIILFAILSISSIFILSFLPNKTIEFLLTIGQWVTSFIKKDSPFKIDHDISFSNVVGMKLIILSWGKHLFSILNIFLIMRSVGMKVNIEEILIVSSLVFFVNHIGATPAGIGLADATWFGVLTFINVELKIIGIFVVVEKILDIVATLICTIITFLYYLIKNILNNFIKRQPIEAT